MVDRGEMGICELTANTDCKGLVKVLFGSILNDFIDITMSKVLPPSPPPSLPGLVSSSKHRRIDIVQNKWHTIVIRLTVAFASMCTSEVASFFIA